MSRKISITAEMLDDEGTTTVEVNPTEDIVDGLMMLEASVRSYFKVILPDVISEDRRGLINDFLDNLRAGLNEELEEPEDSSTSREGDGGLEVPMKSIEEEIDDYLTSLEQR